jgi:Cell wall-active antibiotics response 4TMS YvqF
VIGAAQLLGLVWRSRLLAPLVLILLGGAGLAVLHSSPSDLAGPPSFWPVVVVLAGLALALAEPTHRTSNEANIDQAAVLRTRTVRRTERPFKVARVRALFGSLELDLTRCRSLTGNVQVNVSVWLGYVRIVVPDDYQVTVHSEAIAVRVPVVPPSDGTVVVVKVSALGFGGAVDLRRSWTQPTLASNPSVGPETTPVSA